MPKEVKPYLDYVSTLSRYDNFMDHINNLKKTVRVMNYNMYGMSVLQRAWFFRKLVLGVSRVVEGADKSISQTFLVSFLDACHRNWPIVENYLADAYIAKKQLDMEYKQVVEILRNKIQLDPLE